MEETGNGREIEVRSLTGESIRVSLEPNKTVEELKLLLTQNFSQASCSPNFHLFLKGVKLKPHCHLSSYLIGDGDFLVFVPFAKRERQPMHRAGASETQPSDPNSSKKLAESAWSDLMQDLSSLHDVANNETLSEAKLNVSSAFQDRYHKRFTSRTKSDKSSKRDIEEKFLDDVLSSILLISGDDVFDHHSVKKFIDYIDSSSCLSNPSTGCCVMREANDLMDCEIDPSMCKSSLCLCPLWLKDIMKAFSFINIYTACLQLRQKKITFRELEGLLDQLHKFGLRPGIGELENLSQVCPQVLQIIENEGEVEKLRDFKSKFHDAIVIVKCSSEANDQNDGEIIAAAKLLPRSKILNSIRKREDSLKAILSAAVKSLVFKNEEMLKSFSVEDLLLKKTDTVATETEMRMQGKRRYSAASSSGPCEALCHDTSSLHPEEMVLHLKSTLGSQGQMVHVEEIRARNANFVEIPCQLSEDIKSALLRMGITRLYSHQAESIQASLSGKNVVVATMTSSGKSLCYNIPVLEELLRNPSACALYFFPTKALAQDQLRALSDMSYGLSDSLNIGVYDGDTSHEDRLWLRDNARLLITNPDMLHVSILPFHGHFRRILANLRFIVIDEAHAYKGTFGCHVAQIFRRLRRICSHAYSSDPSFVFCTATSANPQEHAMELANLPSVELISNDGSPSSLKLFMLWNPPLCLKTVLKRPKNSFGAKQLADKNVVSGRTSPILEVSYLFAEMVQHGLRCIAFCKTRKLCELVLCYTREILQKSAPHLENKICSYRGGYIAEDRRRIETDFFCGRICGIAATNALELGIDVGHIDVTLHLGFPGSIASLWQQAGRSGRREKPSIAIYVAFEGPLDQFFMKFPHKLFRGPVECCHVDANNEQVLQQHLMCAAFEYPLSLVHDEKYFGPGLERAIMTLNNKGFLSTDLSRDSAARIWTYIGHEKSPSAAVNVRAIETQRYKVIDKNKNEVLEEIEESKAFFQVYEGAVYMNQGKMYLVKSLDLSSKIAWCSEADVNYYTKTRDYTDIHVIGSQIAYPPRITMRQFSTTAQVHTCKVTTTWFGFRRIWRRSNKLLDTVGLSLPDYSYESQAVWLRVPQSVKTAVETSHLCFRGGLHAAGHALLNVIPLFIICNQSDLASECANPHDNRYVPERILLYDPRPGGTGFSAKARPLFTELLESALELLSSCHCSEEYGCPNCVQNLSCREYNEVLHKDAAIMIIKGVLEAEKSHLKRNAGHPHPEELM